MKSILVSGFEATFVNDVTSLSAVVEEMGSPFLEEIEDLLVLDTRDNMHVTVWETVKNVEILGKKQYLRFGKERRIASAKPITEPLHKTSYHCSVVHLWNLNQNTKGK